MCFRAFWLRLSLSGALLCGSLANAAETSPTFSEAAASTPASSALMLDEALAIARAANTQIRAAEREAEAARAQRLQADGIEPLTLFYDWEESDTLNPNRAGNRRIGIEQEIDWPGKRLRRKQAGGLNIEASEALVERARLRVFAQVRKNFDQVLAGIEIERLLRAMVERLREAVSLSRVRFQSGAGQYLDVLRTQVALQRAQNELRDAEVAAREARRRLNILLGRGGDRVEITGALTLPPLPPLNADVVTGPTFVLAERRIAQAERQRQAARAGRYPDLRLSVARQRLDAAGGNENAWAGSVGLRVPLPGSDRQRGLEAEALAAEYIQRERMRALTLNAQARLQQRYDEARALDEQMRAYRDAILPDVDDQLKAAQQEYRVRRIDALNLLDVYNTYLETQRGYLESLARYRGALIDIETLGEDLWEIDE